MTLGDYVKDKLQRLIFQAVLGLISLVYLKVCGLQKNQLLIFYTVWAVLLSAGLLSEWLRRKKYFDEIFRTMKELDKPYLISEVLPSSWRLEDRLYGEILKTSNKSVVDAIHHMEKEQKEYKEFIENWIHEVKVPVTAISLICDNEKSKAASNKKSRAASNEKNKAARKIKSQLIVLENAVEKALFYARSDRVYQDYLIRLIELDKVVYDVLERGQMYFRMNEMQIEVEAEGAKAYCDDKWLAFILNQILVNAVKYKKKENSKIVIKAEKREGKELLSIWDNGVGIAAEELPRVFEKGFTGSNGRLSTETRGQGEARTRTLPAATGIGLYLCRKLCRKLDMGIAICSEQGVYTCVSLAFPDGSGHFGREGTECQETMAADLARS